MSDIDIAVVGAGPAGVAAAVTAAQAGTRVLLIDEQGRAGGQYFKQPAAALAGSQFPPALAANIQKGRELLAGLAHARIVQRLHTLVWDVTPDRTLRLYTAGQEGRADVVESLTAKRLIIAAGAYERVMPFPGWTLPGVMTVGGAQLLLKGQGLLPGRRLLLAGTGPLLQVAGVQLHQAGAEIAAIVELQGGGQFLSRAFDFWGHWDKVGQALDQRRQLARAGVPFKTGRVVIRALGEQCVTGAVIGKVDGDGRLLPRSQETLQVDTICLNFGFVPATELTRLAGCRQRFDPHFGALATETNEEMETSQPGIFAVGEVRGIGGVDVALIEGQIAGAVAARQLGYQAAEVAPAQWEAWRRARSVVESLGAMFPLRPGLCELATDEVVVCRCEEVTAGEIREAARGGATDLNALKTWTRAGMGRCQGRVCGPIIAQLLAQAAGLPVEAAGAFTARPPLKPLPLAALAAHASAALQWEDHVTQYGYVRTKKSMINGY